MIRIALADDQEMVRAGIRLLVDEEPDMTVVAEAADGAAAIDAVARARPDVVVMDIRMPVLDGIEATRRLVDAGSPTAVLVLTTFDDDEHVFGALRAGAAGFLLKESRPQELIDGIRAIHDGGSLVAPGPTRRLSSDGRSSTPPARRPRPRAPT